VRKAGLAKRKRSRAPISDEEEDQQDSESADDLPTKQEVRAMLAEAKTSKQRVPDLPKPPVYNGHASDMVEDRLFVFENYLAGSNIPKDRWPYHIMPLLSDKALSAWMSVAVPAQNANVPLTWELFKSCMLTNFAHPDRQHQAREKLHKIAQQNGQSATDYVRYFNTLVQKAGDPPPSNTDLILFFHSGLLPGIKDKCITNPGTGKFWTDLQALQEFTISLHTHGATKPAHMAQAAVRHSFPPRSKPARLAYLQNRPAKAAGKTKFKPKGPGWNKAGSSIPGGDKASTKPSAVQEEITALQRRLSGLRRQQREEGK